MLNRVLLTAIAFFFLCSNSVYSQSCVIDTLNYDLIAPTAEEMPCIEMGVSYNGTLQFFTPPDLAGTTIDSIHISTFHNLPTGITTVCTPIVCSMVGNGRACISLEGTTTDTVGTYHILYDGTVYTSQGNPTFNYLRNNFPGVLPDFYLIVINPGDQCPNTLASGVKNINGEADQIFTVYPNPNTGSFTFKLNGAAKPNGEVKVVDATGRIVYSQLTGAATFFQTTIDLSNLSKGVYMVEYRTAQGFTTKKITIN
jgi:hypothetical protein